MGFVEGRDMKGIRHTESSPLLYYTFAYIFGILASPKFHTKPSVFAIIAFSAAGIALSLAYLVKHRDFICSKTIIKTILLFAIFFAGCFNNSLRFNSIKNKQHSSLLKERNMPLILIVKNSVKISRNYSSAICLAKDYNEKVLLYFNKEFKAETVEIGDLILINYSGKPIVTLIRDGNSYWVESLINRGVLSYGYANTGHFEVIKPARRSVTDAVFNKRDAVIRKLIRENPGKVWVSVVTAISSGDKSHLDNRIKKAFMASGSMHLMAVSGFHASLIFMFLSGALSFLGNYRIMKLIRGLIIAASLLLMVTVAGFTPSALRAVIMLSFHIIASIFCLRTISLNTLCASALLITVADPEAIYDYGFILSYCAFLSIIFINPRIMSLLKSNNVVIRKIWEIVSLSLSCQIGTALISVNLFGSFSPYFLLSNLLLIPLVTVILYIAVIWGITSLTGIYNEIFTRLLDILCNLTVWIVSRIESLPFSSVKVELNEGMEISLITIIVVQFIDLGLSEEFKRIITAGASVSLALCLLL